MKNCAKLSPNSYPFFKDTILESSFKDY